ncbi:MAG: hypothetical protein K0M70_02925 [Arenimonas sp.]|uniref:hypothetical protein n=1 Tax=Arenimonas sp. TaxID=1872635 RepID=UPI0025BE4EF4|nr:hypothetical protein [Arenimonas sp.]MBW8366795.1 hypothetical protein [Arenimonas sp.]
MSAQLIPFPGAGKDWTDLDHHVFKHFRSCDGLSVDEARGRVEASIHSRRIVPGEDESARLLRMAGESLRQLKKLTP